MATAQDVLEKARNTSKLKYMFPKNRIENVRHKMLMNFYKFDFYTGANQISNPNWLKMLDSTASIILPIPIKIFEKYDAQYASVDNMNLVKSAVEEMARRAGASVNATQFALNIGAAAMNLKGQSINPYTTIRFKGMPLRRHNFRWKLSPESKENTDEIESIIKAISLRMHPESSVGEVILKYPELINFRILGPKNPDHVFPTAPCVIDSFNVDRTGGDYPSFFKGSGTPVVYGVQMSVIEILPLIRSNDSLKTTGIFDLNN